MRDRYEIRTPEDIDWESSFISDYEHVERDPESMIERIDLVKEEDIIIVTTTYEDGTEKQYTVESVLDIEGYDRAFINEINSLSYKEVIERGRHIAFKIL